MAPIKRKANSTESTTSKRPEKRIQVGTSERMKESSQNGRSKSKPSTKSEPSASDVSILRDEEPSFPRGGASVLTPLERKQVQNQATTDVLFEQKGPKRPADDVGVSDEDDNDDAVEAEQVDEPAAAPKKSHKKKRTSRRDSEPQNSGEANVRTESLNFKVYFPFRSMPLLPASELTCIAHRAGINGPGSSIQY